MKSYCKDADPPDELLLNTMATINNLSYYMVEEGGRSDEDDARRAGVSDATVSMLRLASSLRPLTYRLARDRCHSLVSDVPEGRAEHKIASPPYSPNYWSKFEIISN